MVKKCWDCGTRMKEMTGEYKDGVTYKYWKCTKCKREVLDMEQLHEVAEKYRELRRAYAITVSKWGTALAFRIPKEIVQKQRIKEGEKALLIPEKTGFKIIPEKK